MAVGTGAKPANGNANSPPAQQREAVVEDAPQERVGPRWDPTHPDYFELNQAGLHGGRLKREDVGAAYDGLIGRIAHKHAASNINAGLESRAALFCGYKEWPTLVADLESQDPRLIPTRAMLKELSDLAMKASADVDAYAQISWEDPRRLEVYNPDAPHSTEDWIARNYPPNPKDSLFSSVTTTRAGDRVFQLHFFSVDHPALEAQLERIKTLKSQYWMARR